MNSKSKKDYTLNWELVKDGYYDSKQRATSLSALCKKIDTNYNTDQTAWYEYTQTIGPKKGYKKTGERSKTLYNDLPPKKQIKQLKKRLIQYIGEEDITGLVCFEFNKNGNIHFHGLLRHTGGYEIHLRRVQQHMKKEFGRNSLSKVNSIEKYGGYILKDIQQTGIYPLIINEHIIDKTEDRHKINYYLNEESDSDTD